MISSFHHCPNQDIQALFANLHKISKHTTDIIMANEVSVGCIWITKRFIGSLLRRDFSSFFGPVGEMLQEHDGGIRKIYGNYYRTRKNIKDIFLRNGYRLETYEQYFIGSGFALDYFYGIARRVTEGEDYTIVHDDRWGLK